MLRKLLAAIAVTFAAGQSMTATAALIGYAASLTGAAEVPGQGDPDGFGKALFIFDSVANRVDWRIIPSSIDLPLTGAHIHLGSAGVAGPVVINFSAQTSGSVVDLDVAAVLANPANFYVNLHNGVYPLGAIRGQLIDASLLAFTANLTGSAEVPGLGDTDGSGLALLSFDSVTNRVDWLIAASNIDLPLTGAHIHLGSAGVAGPVVINFSAHTSGSVVDLDVATVLANPANFYVNLHNGVYPLGAIRGQLVAPSSVVAEPPMLALLGLAIAALSLARRRR